MIAARQRPRGPIESAPADDARRHVLLVATLAVEEPGAVAEISRAAELGTVPGDVDVLVLAPARIRFLDRWASDVEPAREAAQRNLVATVAALAKAGVEAEARVGDEDVVQAVEDQLQTYPATDVVLVSARGRGGGRGGERRTERAPRGRVPPRRARLASAQQTCGRAALRTTWKALPGMRFSWLRFSSSQRRSLLPLKYQLEPLSATIIP